MTVLRSISGNSVPLVREKLSRPLTISEARKVCCVILSSSGPSGLHACAAHLFGQHLRIGGDDGQRSIDFVGDAGGEQADGGELLRLGELGFEFDAVGDVVDQNDAADGGEVAGDQRSDGDVGGALLAGAGLDAEFVEIVDACTEPSSPIARWNSSTKDAGKTRSSGVQGLGAGQRVHHFHLRVPALDALFEIDGEDADVDRLDDVLVEFLEPLIFRGLLLQTGVEARVLQGDADVAGEGLEQLHVLAGEEVGAVVRPRPMTAMVRCWRRQGRK